MSGSTSAAVPCEYAVVTRRGVPLARAGHHFYVMGMDGFPWPLLVVVL